MSSRVGTGGAAAGRDNNARTTLCRHFTRAVVVWFSQRAAARSNHRDHAQRSCNHTHGRPLTGAEPTTARTAGGSDPMSLCACTRGATCSAAAHCTSGAVPNTRALKRARSRSPSSRCMCGSAAGRCTRPAVAGHRRSLPTQRKSRRWSQQRPDRVSSEFDAFYTPSLVVNHNLCRKTRGPSIGSPALAETRDFA